MSRDFCHKPVSKWMAVITNGYLPVDGGWFDMRQKRR